MPACAGMTRSWMEAAQVRQIHRTISEHYAMMGVGLTVAGMACDKNPRVSANKAEGLGMQLAAAGMANVALRAAVENSGAGLNRAAMLP